MLRLYWSLKLLVGGLCHKVEDTWKKLSELNSFINGKVMEMINNSYLKMSERWNEVLQILWKFLRRNIDRIETGLWRFICKKVVVSWKIILHLQGNVVTFERCQVCKERTDELQRGYVHIPPFLIRFGSFKLKASSEKSYTSCRDIKNQQSFKPFANGAFIWVPPEERK